MKKTDNNVVVVAGGDVVKLSPAEIEQRTIVITIAADIIAKTGEVGQLYLKLITYIRAQSVAPAHASAWLKGIGFNKVRVSEIMRVAMSPDDIYMAYAAKSIGFIKTLDLARMADGGKAEPTAATAQLTKAGFIDVDELDQIEQDTIGAQADTKAAKRTKKQKMDAAARTIFANATRASEWASGDGWKLQLVKVKTAKAAVEKTETKTNEKN